MSEIPKQYNQTDQSYREIAGLRRWDLMLTGNLEIQSTEPRCNQPIREICQHLSENCQHARIFRNPDKGADGKFVFEIGEEREEISAQGFRKKFEKIIAPLGEQPISVLMNVTSLELDAIIHIQDFFHQSNRSRNLFAMYTSPAQYVGRDNYKLRLNEIAQPPGHVSLRMDGFGHCPHVFILGFDKGRALRFFAQYDEWRDSEKYAVIVNPPYVEDGANEAKKANRWIEDLQDEHVFHVSALEPFRLCEKLQTLYNHEKRLDIIPLGPKLMFLGATRFYFSLSEEERNNVRILYDFPQASSGDTSAIGEHYLLNLNSCVG